MAKSWAPWFGDRVYDRRCVPPQPCGFDITRGIETRSAETAGFGPTDESPSVADGAPESVATAREGK